MEFFDKKKISIITENPYQDQIVKMLEDSGVSGFTIYKDIYGKGKNGVRGDYGSLTDVSGNLEIVTITGLEIANVVLQKLARMIERGAVIIVHVTDVKVIRDIYFS